MCDLADISPAKFGQVQNYITPADKYGTFTSRNDFVGVTVDARLPQQHQV